MNDPRGSCWRKWDLHIHTPYSELNNGFETGFSQYAQKMLITALDKRIACVGITDYFLVRGYKELRELLADEEKLSKFLSPAQIDDVKKILFLPNIEFRSSRIIQKQSEKGEKKDSRINFHIIFSDSVSAETIEEDFLREIKFAADSGPATPEEEWSLTTGHLSDLGKKLKEQHAKFRERSNLFVGMMNAVVDHNEVIKILENKASKFRNKYLFVLPCDEDLSKIGWDGQGHQTRKLFYQSAHILFSANPNTRKFALGKSHNSVDEYLEEFKTLKPCLHGSDAHCFEELFEPAEGRYTWVKADPTFAGLRKTLIEPEERVFIGQIPEQLQHLDTCPTKFIKSVSIRKKPKSTLKEHWFNCQLPLNPSLIAIIGNKGNGKSALGETIGLLGKTKSTRAFSFLSEKRFRQVKNNKSTHFEGTLEWVSGGSETAPLDENPESNAYELVKYIPQNYLENLCNELGTTTETSFDEELRSVIFSHVKEEDRLGKTSLEDLIEYKTTQANKKVEILKKELAEITANLVALERKASSEYRTKLEGGLAAKRHELDSHEKNKPIEVPKPETSPEQKNDLNVLTQELTSAKEKLAEANEAISKIKAQLAPKNLLISAAQSLISLVENFERQVETFKAEAIPDIQKLGLQESDVFSLKLSKDSVANKCATLIEEKTALERDLDENVENSPAEKRKKLEDELKGVQSRLDAPHKNYEAYLARKAGWEKKRQEIIGSQDTPDSIEFYKEQIKNLSLISDKLISKRKNAVDKSKEIFREKAALAEVYSELYRPVQDFIDSNSVAKEQLQLLFNVEIADTGFADTFFTYVSQGVRGTFCGTEEGRKRLSKTLSDSDLSSEDGVGQFIERMIASLLMDERDGQAKTDVKDLVRKGQKVQSLYDFIYGLDYLRPKYSMGISGKALHELSPGERGALLLVFYLLVDQDDVPLVIDQPEENLDNQTVFNLLVPCVKAAKKRRQILIITHNPNLAVVCDAEQIICCSIDKHDGNRLTYKTGSIENPEINKLVINILEGTRPAFDNRGSKYLDKPSAF